MNPSSILIGIAGASGSGKTLVANTLCGAFDSSEVMIIQEDAYYKDITHLPMTERAQLNFDHPDAFDHDLLVENLKDLLAGRAIEQPVYDYSTHTRSDETRHLEPRRVTILEGILVLAIPELRELMNIKIFIDTDLDICFLRRLKRDMRDRGRTVESVIQQFQETVRPMYFQFISPSKRHADLIIPRGGKNRVALDIVIAKIETLLYGVADPPGNVQRLA